MEKARELLVKQFIELQRYSMNLGKPSVSFDDCDWKTLVYLSRMNKSSLLFNNAVNKDMALFHVGKDICEEWNTKARKEFMDSYNMFSQFKRVMTALSDNNIKGIVIKGYVIAALYPDIFSRYSSDLDIKFDEKDRDKVHKLLIDELGFYWNEADSKKNVYLYYNRDLLIEAHYTLWEDYHGDNIDVLIREELDKPETLIEVPVTDDLKVWTLGCTEHLILQMFHIVKHYIVEGIESRYFTDITYFVNRYKDEIDFERFYRVFREMSFDNFCKMYFTECIEHFGMDESILPEVDRVHPDDEMAFFNDIVFLGKKSLNDKASYSLLGILSPYVNGKKETAESKSSRMIQALFPSVKDIDDKYAYCKKHHFLLPVAWIHRAFRTVFFKLTKGGRVYGVKDKITESEYRIQMMKNSKIL